MCEAMAIEAISVWYDRSLSALTNVLESQIGSSWASAGGGDGTLPGIG